MQFPGQRLPYPKLAKKGDFVLADKIRSELLNKGIIIEDQKGKTIWKYK